MNQAELNLIKEKINIITESEYFTVGRDAAMCWIGFQVNGVDYALHLQSSFRFRSGEEVLAGNLDMFEPSKAQEEAPGFNWNTFQWDVKGANRFDEWADRFQQDGLSQVPAQKVTVTAFGDLTIEFAGNLTLEVFANAAFGECWRFFDKNTGDDLIVTAQGLEE